MGYAKQNLDAALSAVDRGWFVFPCFYSNGQHVGYVRYVRDKAFTKYPAQVKAWARQFPDCYFALHHGPSGLCTLDIDDKNGKQGSSELFDLELAHGALPETFTQATPSGGRHYIFTGELRNSAGGIAAGIDTRGDGGLIPVPGSHVPGKGDYVIINDVSPAPVPEWVVEKAKPRDRDVVTQEPLTEWDQPANIERFERWLRDAAPEATEGAGGDDTTVKKVAVRGKDYGLSIETAYGCLLEHWNPTKANPPWSPEELYRKVVNAYQYLQENRPGSATPEALFAGQTLDLPKDGGLPPWLCRASTINAIDLPRRDWILGTTYINRYVTATIAPGGVGKSMLSLLRACAIASGKPLTGEKVHKKGPVVVFNAEDPLDELQRRVAAIRQEFGLTRDDLKDLYLFSGHDQPVRLASEGKDGVVVNTRGVGAFIELCKRVGAILVILDPFVRIHNVSENNNNAIDAVARVLSHDICKGADCAVNVVHHSRKLGREGGNGDAETARGASSLVSAVRIAETVGNMTEQEATKKYGLPPGHHLRYIRVDGAKANLAPALASAVWFEKVSVKLANGDGVGVLKPAELALIEAEDGEQAVLKEIARFVRPGETRSFDYLAGKLADESMLDGKKKKQRGRLDKMFLRDFEFEGYLYRKIQEPSKTNKDEVVDAVRCEEGTLDA